MLEIISIISLFVGTEIASGIMAFKTPVPNGTENAKINAVHTVIAGVLSVDIALIVNTLKM